MSSVSDDKRFTISRRVRDLLYKPKEPATPPVISQPSRLPVRQKRGYGEVDTNDSDKSDINNRSSSSATSRGARVRQRTESTSSVATIKPGSKSLDLERKPSCESIKTMIAPTERKHTRASSAIQLDPGRSNAALTRSTSYNRMQVEDSLPSACKDGCIPFPTAKATSALGAYKNKPLKRESSSMMSIVSTETEVVAPTTKTVPSSISRRLTRSSSSMMSIVSENEAARPKVSRIPVASVPSTKTAKHSPRDDLDSELDRALIEEIEDAETNTRASRFRDMLKSVSRSTSRRGSQIGRSRPSMFARSFASACVEDNTLLKGWKRGRFDVKIEPQERHLTVWDAKNTEVMAWCGTLIIEDTSSPEDLNEPQYDYPPIEELELEFSSLEDPPPGLASATPSPTSSPSSRSGSAPASPSSSKPEWNVAYLGEVLPRDKSKGVNPALGIILEPNWQWGYAPTLSSDSSAAEDKPKYIVRFYVPVPVKLFSRCEYRRFRLTSRAVFGDRDAGLSPLVAHSGVVDVAVEHLRKETHMDGRKPLGQLAAPKTPTSSP